MDTATSPLTRLAVHLSDDMAATSAIIGEQSSSPVPLAGAITNHLFSAGGKRTRPLLLLACARLCGYEGTVHHNMAAAAEMIHTATLLHDDVVDKSSRRRGRETAHLLYGEREAILGGDFLLGKAFALIASMNDGESLGIMAEAAAKLAEGELRQLSLTSSPFVDEAEYFRIIEGKTATLFEAVCHIGAVLAGAPEEYRKALAHFGRFFGIAFQLVDDALDYRVQSHTDETIGNDFREGKMTLPVILARAAGDEEERQFWDSRMIAPSRTDGDFTRALELIIAHGGVEETMIRAEKYARNAQECLAVLPHSPLREMMMEAVEACARREA